MYYADTPWISITFFSTVILCVLLYLILCLFQWYATRLSLEKRQECSFRELFIDLKDNNNSGLYALFEFSRISIILICLTYGSAIPFISRSILFSLFQLFYAGVMTKHRPFEKVVWNIMKLVNEFFYFLLSSLLLFLQYKEDWSEGMKSIYYFLLTSVCVQLFIACFVNFIITISQKCKSNQAARAKIEMNTLTTGDLRYFQSNRLHSNDNSMTVNEVQNSSKPTIGKNSTTRKMPSNAIHRVIDFNLAEN